MNFSHNNKGFKPNAIRNLTNITVETLRYWRNHLDPRKEKSYFSGRDVLMYAVFKLLIHAECVPAKKLKKFNWNPIFQNCYQMTIKQLMNCAVVYDALDENLYFTNKAEEIPLADNWIHCVTFQKAKEFIENNALDFGRDNTVHLKDNIVPINSIIG